jgi:hypothetical protein
MFFVTLKVSQTLRFWLWPSVCQNFCGVTGLSPWRLFFVPKILLVVRHSERERPPVISVMADQQNAED